jgi:hypothetical protein
MRIRVGGTYVLGALFFIAGASLFSHCTKTPSAPDRPLMVSAGSNSTVKLNEDVYVAGSAVEEGVADSVFLFSWKLESGPDSVQIFSPSSPITRVKFNRTGSYHLSLTVSDGVISKSATVIYTVIDSITFAVRNPVAGDRIVIGDSTTIRWQIVTPMTQTMIDLSLDKGITWTILTNPSVLSDTVWVWHVDPNLAPAESCLVKIRDYNNSTNIAVSGYFSLVK